jgi:hypothetical protein
MKKTILIIALALLALGALGIGVVSAQDGTQPYAPGGMMGGYGGGWMHDYVEKALAEKFGITEAQVEEQLAAGQTLAQIALDNGIAEADVTAFLTEVHTAAFDNAVADGVLTREQADLMLGRMQAAGFTSGSCPMLNGQTGQPGQGFGPGMMRNGQDGAGMMNRWQNQNP